jgi:hypothetical protein
LDDVLANRPTERDSLIVAVRKAFKALEEPHLIPVTENTLPEAENMYRRPTKRYLCQRESGGVRQFFVGARLCDPEGYLKDWWDWYGVKIHNAEVVAYMPLPEPYKGVTE